jgi:multidrug efflux system membrane fusion protein
MLFKPDLNETAKAAGGAPAWPVARAPRMVSIHDHAADPRRARLHRLDALQQKAGRPTGRAPDLPVPVLAATPRIQDVPVYLDGVGSVRALNNVTGARAGRRQADRGQFHRRPGRQEGRRARRDRSVIYQAQYDQAVAKKAQDEAQLANSGSTWRAISSLPPPMPAPSSRPTRSAPSSRSRKRW